MLVIEDARKALEKTADVLESMGIQYYLDSGTLLGAYRDKGIIPYDHDIDIRILPAQVPEDRMSELVANLWNIGYKVIISNYGKRAQLICVNTDDVMLDLKFAFKDKKWLWIYCWAGTYDYTPPRVHCYPLKFFKNIGKIKLYDRKYPTPTPVEGYLEYHYKDWREFKKRPEQAEETDLIWDYMHSPPCALSLEELAQVRAGTPLSAVKTTNKKEGMNVPASKCLQNT